MSFTTEGERMSNLLQNVTILVVEDDEDTCELLRTILAAEGADVVTASSVDQALLSCRSHPPHLIVSDIRLGSSDGFAFIETVREYNREYRGFTPAIALTGFTAPGDEERALASGFNAYIHKPFEPEHLINTITLLLHDATRLVA